MSYSIFSISPFDKQLKRLSGKFPSLKDEYIQLIKDLENNPEMGKSLGNNCYKIRLAIAAKGKGKSGGARIITHIHYEGNAVFLLSIYDKSEQKDITDREIKSLLSFIK